MSGHTLFSIVVDRNKMHNQLLAYNLILMGNFLAMLHNQNRFYGSNFNSFHMIQCTVMQQILLVRNKETTGHLHCNLVLVTHIPQGIVFLECFCTLSFSCSPKRWHMLVASKRDKNGFMLQYTYAQGKAILLKLNNTRLVILSRMPCLCVLNLNFYWTK